MPFRRFFLYAIFVPIYSMVTTDAGGGWGSYAVCFVLISYYLELGRHCGF